MVADKARRLLRLADRVDAELGPEPEEQSIDDPSRWALAREAAAAAMVLLQNREVDGRALLPLDPLAVRRVAVIGPNADVAVIQGGGSARVTPHRVVTPLAGLQARLGGHVEVAFEPGAVTGSTLPVLDSRLAWVDDEQRGVRLTYRTAPDGPELLTTVEPRLDPIWHGRFSAAVDPSTFHVTARTIIRPTQEGIHTFGLTSVGPAKLSLDGMVLLDTTGQPHGSAFFGFGTKQLTADIDLADDDAYELVVEYACSHQDLAGFRVGVRAPLGHDPIGRAAALAATSDVAVVVVGTDEEWETEGRDRRTMALPGTQDALVRARRRRQPPHRGGRERGRRRGSALGRRRGRHPRRRGSRAWPRVRPSPACSSATTSQVAGCRSPCRRSWRTPPARSATPTHRASCTTPRGSSSVTAGTSPTGSSRAGGSGRGRATRRSRGGHPQRRPPGSRARRSRPSSRSPTPGREPAREVVQVYLRRPASSVERPAWVLGGFAKARIEPGATAPVEVTVDPAALRHWDTDRDVWVVEPGPLELRVARSAADPGQVVAVDVQVG